MFNDTPTSHSLGQSNSRNTRYETLISAISKACQHNIPETLFLANTAWDKELREGKRNTQRLLVIKDLQKAQAILSQDISTTPESLKAISRQLGLMTVPVNSDYSVIGFASYTLTPEDVIKGTWRNAHNVSFS